MLEEILRGPRAWWEQDPEPDLDAPEPRPLTPRQARDEYDPDGAYDDEKQG